MLPTSWDPERDKDVIASLMAWAAYDAAYHKGKGGIRNGMIRFQLVGAPKIEGRVDSIVGPLAVICDVRAAHENKISPEAGRQLRALSASAAVIEKQFGDVPALARLRQEIESLQSAITRLTKEQLPYENGAASDAYSRRLHALASYGGELMSMRPHPPLTERIKTLLGIRPIKPTSAQLEMAHAAIQKAADEAGLAYDENILRNIDAMDEIVPHARIERVVRDTFKNSAPAFEKLTGIPVYSKDPAYKNELIFDFEINTRPQPDAPRLSYERAEDDKGNPVGMRFVLNFWPGKPIRRTELERLVHHEIYGHVINYLLIQEAIRHRTLPASYGIITETGPDAAAGEGLAGFMQKYLAASPLARLKEALNDYDYFIYPIILGDFATKTAAAEVAGGGPGAYEEARQAVLNKYARLAPYHTPENRERLLRHFGNADITAQRLMAHAMGRNFFTLAHGALVPDDFRALISAAYHLPLGVHELAGMTYRYHQNADMINAILAPAAKLSDAVMRAERTHWPVWEDFNATQRYVPTVEELAAYIEANKVGISEPQRRDDTADAPLPQAII